MREIFRFIVSEIRGTWRYRWYTVFAAWAVCVVGWLLVLRMPDIYEARTQVFVDADSRLADVMNQVGATPGVGSQVFVVRQALLARPQLEYTAHATGLDKRATTVEEQEELIDDLLENIVVATGRSGEGRRLFTISFRDRDRAMAVSVVDTLLQTFVQDVLKLKDQGTEQATGYLQDQLEYYGELLSEAEQKLAQFKRQNVGLLPGESGGIFERLQIETIVLKDIRSNLQVELDGQIELRRQLAAEEPYIPGATEVAGEMSLGGTSSDQSIRDLEAQRSQLLLAYTERHPDVVAITEQLAQLYKKREEERTALAHSGSGIEGAANANNPVYQSVQIALNECGVRIAALRSQLSQQQRVVAELNNHINTIPEVEARYAELTRDYSQYQSLYDELLEQRERERLATAGKDRDLITFNITDPPAAGLEPIAPMRALFLAGILVVGLGIGTALAWIIHQFNPIFHDARSLSGFAHRPVLGVISMTWLERNRTARRLDVMCFAVAGMALMFVCGLLIVFQDQLVVFMDTLAQGTTT